MRVAAIADIHGNLPALEAVLADIAREDVDGIVVAGDTVAGPWPVEVYDVVTSLEASIVRGNADRAVLERDERFGRNPGWCADRLGSARLAGISSWPLVVEHDVDGLGHVVVCHSTPTEDDPIYTRSTPEDELVALLRPVEADTLVCGHTHIQYDRALATGVRLVNPGSVGMPYEGRRGAYWAILGPDVELRRTDYDVEACVAAIDTLDAQLDTRHLEYLLDPPDPVTTTEYFESLRGA